MGGEKRPIRCAPTTHLGEHHPVRDLLGERSFRGEMPILDACVAEADDPVAVIGGGEKERRAYRPIGIGRRRQ